jgi:hypothetical protein
MGRVQISVRFGIVTLWARTSATLVLSKVRFLLGLRVSWYGFWAYILHASKFSFLLFSATRTTSPGAAASKVPQCGLQTLQFCWTLLTVFAHPKMTEPSWPKDVRPFADGDNVATHGLSIGQLWSRINDITDLLCFQHRRWVAHPHHVIYTYMYMYIIFSLPYPTPKRRKGSGRETDWCDRIQKRHVSMQAPESTRCVPDPLLILGVGSGDESTCIHVLTSVHMHG